MKRENLKSKKSSSKQVKRIQYLVTQRLDESLPLQTEEWTKVEQLLMRLTEFAPYEVVEELVGAIASFADDQARRGYLLGQEDLTQEMKQRVA